MMDFIVAGVLLLGAGLLVAAGCGGGDDNESSGGTTNAATEGTGTPAAQQGGTLKINLQDDEIMLRHQFHIINGRVTGK